MNKNLYYLYTSDRPVKNWYGHYDPTKRTRNKFALRAESDGMITMFDRLARSGVVDSVRVFIDSRSGLGSNRISAHTLINVVPTMDLLSTLISPGDIVVVRGGFKPWIPIIRRIQHARKNWILFYAANTSNTRWPFWDIILDDLMTGPSPKHTANRVYWPFKKPVNENIFYPRSDTKKIYDVCIGASHVHRKKGQFRAVQALVEYEKLTGVRLKAVLPGGFIRDKTNQGILDLKRSGEIDLDLPGAVSRRRLNNIFNKSRVFLHTGAGGQNDRSILEAMRAGTMCGVVNLKRSAPFVKRVAYNIESWEPKKIAVALQVLLRCNLSHLVSRLYQRNNGLEEECIPKMELLLKSIEGKLPGGGVIHV